MRLIVFCAASLIVATGCSTASDARGGGADLAVDPPTHNEVRPTASPQAISLLGHPLYAPQLEPVVVEIRSRELADAEVAYHDDPGGEESIIWLGRRLAYLGQYRDAIAMFTSGLALRPDSYRLLRHRGHRYISSRRFEQAVEDLQRAAELTQGVPDEVEADGLPNRLNIPTSTTHTNIYYHLGLAHYLRAEYDQALDAYRTGLDYSYNNDMRCAMSYWLYLSLHRLDRVAEANEVLAPITPELEIIENHAYHELLLMFKGERTPNEIIGSAAEPGPVGRVIDDATRGYGVGVWYLINDRRTEAKKVFEDIVAGPGWAAFGYIAAEAELARHK